MDDAAAVLLDHGFDDLAPQRLQSGERAFLKQSADERDTLVRGWNATAHPVPDATLPTLFGAQAARTPDAVAVVCGDQELSYGELDARSNRLAHHLRALGVGPEVIVGLCVERSAAMIVGLIGILKAGGAYLPLDPAYPAERLGFMLADAGAPVLLTQTVLRARLPAYGGRLVDLDADWPAIDNEIHVRTGLAPDPSSPAWLERRRRPSAWSQVLASSPASSSRCRAG